MNFIVYLGEKPSIEKERIQNEGDETRLLVCRKNGVLIRMFRASNVQFMLYFVCV